MRFLNRIDWNFCILQKCITRRVVFIRAFACRLQPHLGYPYFVVLVLHNNAAPTIYQLKRDHSFTLTWSATALASGVRLQLSSQILHRLQSFCTSQPGTIQYIAPHLSVTFSLLPYLCRSHRLRTSDDEVPSLPPLPASPSASGKEWTRMTYLTCITTS